MENFNTKYGKVRFYRSDETSFEIYNIFDLNLASM